MSLSTFPLFPSQGHRCVKTGRREDSAFLTRAAIVSANNSHPHPPSPHPATIAPPPPLPPPHHFSSRPRVCPQRLSPFCVCVLFPENPFCVCVLFPENPFCVRILFPENPFCVYVLFPENPLCVCVLFPEGPFVFVFCSMSVLVVLVFSVLFPVNLCCACIFCCVPCQTLLCLYFLLC